MFVPCVPVIVAVATAETAAVATVNVAVVAPAATLTLAGTVALVLLDLRLTTAPPRGAPELSVTVPVEELPPMTAVGANVTEVKTGTLTVSVCVNEMPPLEALMTEEPVAARVATDVIVKVAEVEPAGMVTELGTVATVVVALVRLTAMPPVGAATEYVTVPVDVEPAVTVVGEIVKEASAVAVDSCRRQTPLP